MPGPEHRLKSDAQRRWAFAAEKRGELKRGTALRWAREAKGRDLPERVEGCEGCGACCPCRASGTLKLLQPWWRGKTVEAYEGRCGRPGQRGGS